MTADPYAAWDRAIADGQISDEHDGHPDTLMVPLVQDLRTADIVTLQSCQGHPMRYGEPEDESAWDGHLWIDAERLPALLPSGYPPNFVAAFVPSRGHHEGLGFGCVRETYWPEHRIEFWWAPDDQRRAIAMLRWIFLGPFG